VTRQIAGGLVQIGVAPVSLCAEQPNRRSKLQERNACAQRRAHRFRPIPRDQGAAADAKGAERIGHGENRLAGSHYDVGGHSLHAGDRAAFELAIEDDQIGHAGRLNNAFDEASGEILPAPADLLIRQPLLQLSPIRAFAFPVQIDT